MKRRRKQPSLDPETLDRIQELRAEAAYYLGIGRRIAAIRHIHRALRLRRAALSN
ncbi:MAG: hypothetical protein Q7P63_01310 [Verrucomicrobiota bacterium JB022]|nr:hypothetical protein [Verrucomicrobiota bacterium JB022]